MRLIRSNLSFFFSSTIFNNISAREKLLDHAVHTSGMRVKWLHNMELILLEHISTTRTSTSSLHASFISTMISNFLKIFIIRPSNDNCDELAFHQFGLTFYLRYFLLELSTSEHGSIHGEKTCSECERYSQILRLLFDLLFDLIECDLCQMSIRDRPRSSLIEEDYFQQFQSTDHSSFDRIKLLIYFIELIGLHRYQCPQTNDEGTILRNEDQFFHWIEDFLRHLFQTNQCNSKTTRLAVCFNVMDLCLVFVKDRNIHVERVSFIERMKDIHGFVDRCLSSTII